LFTLGVLVFKDAITLKKIIGLCLCVSGILLLNLK
jgi:multidrug transporter EmrE-like cation transporter